MPDIWVTGRFVRKLLPGHSNTHTHAGPNAPAGPLITDAV